MAGGINPGQFDSSVELGGGTTGAGSQSIFVSLTAESPESIDDWGTGNHSIFLAGGTMAGIFTTTGVNPLNGIVSWEYTQAVGSLNDWGASELQPVPIRSRGKFVHLRMPYNYNGGDGDIQVVIWDATNLTKLTTTLDVFKTKEGIPASLVATVFMPSDCENINVGFHTVAENDGAILKFDDIEVDDSPLVLKNTVTDIYTFAEESFSLSVPHNSYTTVNPAEVSDETNIYASNGYFTIKEDGVYDFDGAIRWVPDSLAGNHHALYLQIWKPSIGWKTYMLGGDVYSGADSGPSQLPISSGSLTIEMQAGDQARFVANQTSGYTHVVSNANISVAAQVLSEHVVTSLESVSPVSYHRTSEISVPINTKTFLDFQTKKFDDQNLVLGAGGGDKTVQGTGWRYVCPSDGIYSVSAKIPTNGPPALVAGRDLVQIYVGGSIASQNWKEPASTDNADLDWSISIDDLVRANAGDMIELAYENAHGNTVVTPMISGGTSIAIHKVDKNPLGFLPSNYEFLNNLPVQMYNASDWTDFTPSSSWTTAVTHTGKWRRVGTNMEVMGWMDFSGDSDAGTLTVDLPAGYSIDPEVFDTVTPPYMSIESTLTIEDEGNKRFQGRLRYNDSNTLTLVYFLEDGSAISQGAINGTNPISAYGANDWIWYKYSVPIEGWTSYSDHITLPAEMVKPISYGAADSSIIANNTPTYIDFPVKHFDDQDLVGGVGTGHKVAQGTGWRYVCPSAGKYNVHAQLHWIGASNWPANRTWTTSIVANGVTKYIGRLENEAAGVNDYEPVIPVTGIVDCQAGDTIEILGYQNSGSARYINAGPSETFVNIYKIDQASDLSFLNAEAVRNINVNQSYNIVQQNQNLNYSAANQYGYNLATAAIENHGEELIVAIDNASQTRTEFTAKKACHVTVHCAANIASTAQRIEIMKNSVPYYTEGSAAYTSNSYTTGSASMYLEAGEWFTIGSSSATGAGSANLYTSFYATALSEHVVTKSTVPDMYREGGGYSDFAITGPNWSTNFAWAIPYITGNGEWMMKFGIRGSTSATTGSLDLDFSGIDMDGVPHAITFTQTTNTTTATTLADTQGASVLRGRWSVADVQHFAINGEVRLARRPDWAEDVTPNYLAAVPHYHTDFNLVQNFDKQGLGSSFTHAGIGDLRFGTVNETGDSILSYSDSNGAFTALKRCTVHISFSGRVGAGVPEYVIYKSGTTLARQFANAGQHATVSASETLEVGQNIQIATTLALSPSEWQYLTLTAQATEENIARPANSNLTSWTGYTPVLSDGTNVTTNDAVWRRVGDTIEAEGIVSWGGAGSGATFQVSLPTGLSIDLNKISEGAITNTHNFGFAEWRENGVGTKAMKVKDWSTTQVVFTEHGTTNTWDGSQASSGDRIAYRFSIPIQGWHTDSTILASINETNNTVGCRYSTAGTQAQNIVVKYTDEDYDTHGAYDTSTGVFTFPESGVYRYSASISRLLTQATSQYITVLTKHNTTWKTADYVWGTGVAGQTLTSKVCDTVQVIEGDTFEVWTDTNIAGDIGGNAWLNYFSIEKIGN